MPTHHFQPNSSLQGSHGLLKGGGTSRRRGFKNLSGASQCAGLFLLHYRQHGAIPDLQPIG